MSSVLGFPSRRSTDLFSWSAGAGATQYSMSVGTTGVGSFNLYSQGQGTNLSATVNGLPVDGSPVYVRLWTQLGGGTGWQFNDYTYTAAMTVAGRRTWDVLSPHVGHP